MVGVMRERVAPGADLAGRAPTEVGVVVGAVTVVDRDGVAARARARSEVAMYLAVVAGLDPTVTVEPELISRIASLVADGEDVAAGRLINDDLLDLFAFAGTPEQVAGAGAGADRRGRRACRVRHPARVGRRRRYRATRPRGLTEVDEVR